MHEHDMDGWRHSHDFGGHSGRAETSTRRVIALTAVMMVIEIVAGTASGSMALLADGWHMATHVAAFGITLFAYRYARRTRATATAPARSVCSAASPAQWRWPWSRS